MVGKHASAADQLPGPAAARGAAIESVRIILEAGACVVADVISLVLEVHIATQSTIPGFFYVGQGTVEKMDSHLCRVCYSRISGVEPRCAGLAPKPIKTHV